MAPPLYTEIHNLQRAINQLHQRNKHYGKQSRSTNSKSRRLSARRLSKSRRLSARRLSKTQRTKSVKAKSIREPAFKNID